MVGMEGGRRFDVCGIWFGIWTCVCVRGLYVYCICVILWTKSLLLSHLVFPAIISLSLPHSLSRPSRPLPSLTLPLPSLTPSPLPHSLFLLIVPKVQELLKRANGRLPEVNWKIAVQALCANDMDVTTAFCALQAEGLQPLYDYVFGEWQKVKRDDMEELKTQINEGRIEAEVRLVLVASKLLELGYVSASYSLPPSLPPHPPTHP